MKKLAILSALFITALSTRAQVTGAAAQTGNLELLILLLESGAEVNVRMEGGKLPADLAREKGFTEIAEILSD